MALNRAEMEQIIRSGGSVAYGNQILTTIAQLPSDAALAVGDPVKEQAAMADLQAQIAALQEQAATLSAAQSSPQANGTEGNATPPVMGTALPDDFPFATALRAAGYTTREQVAQATDKLLDAVPAIDKEAIKQIRTALEA